MLSIAPVASGGGAAAYYAGENYYTDGQLTEHSQWLGRGAETLGLSGKVEQTSFEAVLEGRLPNDAAIPDGTRGEHRPGLDLTFSAPKSVSLLAYVGDDRRLLDAHLGAVRATLGWAEQRFAETRVADGRGRQALVTSGNLIIALFQHDTSRLLDPQAHIHAVIANATLAPNGQWRALAERALWQGRTTVASVYNATFRLGVERLGYETEAAGRHGQFEIAGVSRKTIDAFSQRRAEIVERAQALEHQTPAAMQAVTLRTRGAKPEAVDRAVLHAQWAERAKAIGFDPKLLVERALAQSAKGGEPWQRLVEEIKGITAQARVLAERLGLLDPAHPRDPLVPERPGRMHPDAYAAAHAVASGARHLGEREAGFARTDLLKAALDLGAPVHPDLIEQRIDYLVSKGLLIAEPNGRMLTTGQAVQLERSFLREAALGHGASAPLFARDTAREPPREQATGTREAARGPVADLQGKGSSERGAESASASQDDAEADAGRMLAGEAARAGLRLTRGQMRAGVDILASSDRTIAIQGDAGVGKSAMLRPVARLIEAEGRQVFGLAVSHAIAARLNDDIKVPTQTVAKFLYDHRALLDPLASASLRALTAASLRGAVLVVDEASMLSSADARRLVAIVNAAEVGRLVLIGDAKQLGAVEAGKPFAQMQDRDTTRMRENLRARNDLMKKVHGLAQGHDMFGLAREMEGHTMPTERTAREAAQRWLALGPEERANTMLFVTGRALRSAVNEAVQTMREKAGETKPGLTVRGVLSEVHLTREEQRHPQSYRAGQVVLLARPLTSQGLPAGRMTILAAGERGVWRVRHEDGREGLFRPGRLAANRVGGAVRVFEERDLKVNVGDPIIWRTNDSSRGIHNTDRAVLAGVEGTTAQFIKPNGQLLDMQKTDPMLTRIDLGYAMNAHAAQGATADRAIVVARSDEGKLITPPLLAVLFTRARDEIQLITDSVDKLAGRASRNPGAKTSAVEVAQSDKAPKQMELALPDPKVEAERETQSKAQAAKADVPCLERTRDYERGM